MPISPVAIAQLTPPPRPGSAALVLMLALLSQPAGSQVKPISNPGGHDVFVVAHEDDWQLFMGDVAAAVLKTGRTTTFIYLTAGDNGRDSVYWQTRERAALSSTKVAAGIAANIQEPACRSVTVRQHDIRECVFQNIDTYFLRLPDGRRNGSGFARHDHQSMRRLRVGKIAAITTVDRRATYKGWQDLVSTVDALVGDSARGATLIHTTDPSVTVNPHDHFDHRITGLLIAELRKRKTMDVRYYTGYALATRAANRTREQAREKAAIFLAYDQEMIRSEKSWSAYREHPGFYSDCMLRTYARTPRAR
jgi:LmbE family N-acetylglucosaminyl deacetylase